MRALKMQNILTYQNGYGDLGIRRLREHSVSFAIQGGPSSRKPHFPSFPDWFSPSRRFIVFAVSLLGLIHHNPGCLMV